MSVEAYGMMVFIVRFLQRAYILRRGSGLELTVLECYSLELHMLAINKIQNFSWLMKIM